MQNIVEFHIIGRLGRIDAAKDVTHISVATNYNRREGETWKSNPQWHRVTLFAKLRERLDNATVGDLVRITGRIGQSKYKVEGETRYSVDLIADGFAVLAKAKVKTVEDDMQDRPSSGAALPPRFIFRLSFPVVTSCLRYAEVSVLQTRHQ